MKTIVRFIPNILSAFRLGLAIWFPFSPEHLWIWLVIGGGLSDFLDGWIARRCNVTSWQGGLLDAAADKLFVLSVLTTYVFAGRFSGWWIPAVIVRDLTVVFIAAYAALTGAWDSFRKMDARWSGKLATAGQFLLLVVTAIIPEPVVSVLYLTALVSFIAAIDYGRKFLKGLRLRSRHNRNEFLY